MITRCIFISDLHGNKERYYKLFQIISAERPKAVFLGGDFLPSGLYALHANHLSHSDFIQNFLVKQFSVLLHEMKEAYPRIFLIMGNDDGRFEESSILDAVKCGVWEYIHNRKVILNRYQVYGYSFVPPTPFQLKDWERYDVSRYVDPGSISPEEGMRTITISEQEKKYSTIKNDLDQLTKDENLEKAVFLFHAPPYKTNLDRAALNGQMIDRVPLDLHVGSIGIRRFIEERQPLLTLHGHIHESANITNSWKDRIGRTYTFSAAHDGPELALIRFDLENLDSAIRELI